MPQSRTAAEIPRPTSRRAGVDAAGGAERVAEAAPARSSARTLYCAIWLMRLSRVVYLYFFVSYDPNYKDTSVKKFDYETGSYYQPSEPDKGAGKGE